MHKSNNLSKSSLTLRSILHDLPLVEYDVYDVQLLFEH